jgi:hypothetical protein
MIAKNGIDWDAMGFVVYGDCPEYMGRIGKRNVKNENVSRKPSYKLWSRLIQIDRGHFKGSSGILCDEWRDYDCFDLWFEENHYTVNSEETEFSYRFFDVKNDDIAPDKSVFLPKEVNQLVRNLGRNSPNALIMNVYQQKNTYSIRLFGETIVVSDSKEEIVDIRKRILSVQMLELAEKYEEFLPNKVLEKMIDYRLDGE